MEITFDLSQEEADEIDEVFPGGLFSDRQEMIDGIAKDAVDILGTLLAARRDAAASGAMRWPWSQEAVILRKIAYRYA